MYNDLYPPLQHRTERFTTLKSFVLHLLIPSSLQPLKCIDICCCLHVFILSAWLLTTPWTGARQAPVFMGILQERILEWVAMSSSRGSSHPGIEPRYSASLPHCRQILYHLSHQGSPRILEWVAYPFSRGSSQSRNRTQVSHTVGRFLYQLSYQGIPQVC